MFYLLFIPIIPIMLIVLTILLVMCLINKNKEKRKENLSVILKLLAGFIIFSIIIFVGFYRFISKLQINNISKYEEEYANQSNSVLDKYFPKKIPENAKDISFSSYYGIQSGERGFKLRCTLPIEDIEKYKKEYEDIKVNDPRYFDYSDSVHSFVGYKSFKDDIDNNRYELYSDECNGCGIVIDNNENEILFFWDQFRCRHN